jgi:mannose-1-phosphate guanylyltransferase / mannose-6-phosphate isomerase
MTALDVTPVLLCGGSGSRLWPLSRADRPKQLQVLADQDTMLQATVRRVCTTNDDLQFQAPLVVSGEGHRFQIAEQLLHVGVQPQALLLEPEGRNTAPAVAFAALVLQSMGKSDALMLVMPSDHLIADEAAFRAAIAAAAPAAALGRLVTFGIRPTDAATGYGYIQPQSGEGMVLPVRRFVEKPDAETAQRYIAEGYLWNAGIFLFRASAYLAALESQSPAIAEAVRQAVSGRVTEGLFIRPAPEAFVRSPSISIDFAVMERAPNVSVVPVDMGWSDVGSWDALWRVLPADAAGNVLRGAGALIGCRDSMVRNEGGPFVAALGLTDMVVVATADAVLVAPRDRSEEIRAVVDRLEQQGMDLARTSHEVRRPWGSFRSLDRGDGWQVKCISVQPGCSLSLQTHAKRAETWVVARGEAVATVDGKVSRLKVGESVHIPVGSVHRLENPLPGPLEIIEIQQGDVISEDDIVRLADDYGRAA